MPPENRGGFMSTKEEESQQEEITRDISFEQQDAIREIINDRLADMVWDDYIYLFSFFDSSAGWAYGGSTSPSFAGALSMVTGTTSGNNTYAWKAMEISNLISYTRETRLRTNITFPNNVDNHTGYILTLNDDTVLQGKESATGFKIVDDTIYGVTQVDGKESLATLISGIETDIWYLLELRYFPRERVDFYINGIFLGSLSENLPNSNENGLNIFDVHFQTDTNGQRWMKIEYFEFQQLRK